MKLMRPNFMIHSLRIWNPDSVRIRQKFFLKDEIFFGSDKKSDIRLQGVAGFYARLDFQTEEIHYLESDRIERAGPGEIFQIDSYVFQWKEIRLLKTDWKWPVIFFIAGLTLIATVHFMGKSAPSCSLAADRFASGVWGISIGDESIQEKLRLLTELKKSFQLAVKDKQWAKARAELDGIQNILSREDSGECHVMGPMESLEAQLSKALIVYYLKDLNVQAAAEEVRRFKNRFQSESLDRFEGRILRAARKLYLEGYRIEDEDSEKGSELMEKAQQTCVLLERDSKCVRGK